MVASERPAALVCAAGADNGIHPYAPCHRPISVEPISHEQSAIRRDSSHTSTFSILRIRLQALHIIIRRLTIRSACRPTNPKLLVSSIVRQDGNGPPIAAAFEYCVHAFVPASCQVA